MGDAPDEEGEEDGSGDEDDAARLHYEIECDRDASMVDGDSFEDPKGRLVYCWSNRPSCISMFWI